MSQALIISNVLLWGIVVVLAGVVLALMRQIGVLHERVAPAGALMAARGPRVGEMAPVAVVTSFSGDEHPIGGAREDEASTLLLFVSPTCPVCKVLIPVIESVARSEERELRVWLASDGPRAEHEAFIAEHAIAPEHYVLSRELGMSYQIEKLPTAVLIDGAGILRARGLVNSREHLESLFEAREHGVASLQEYLARDESFREDQRVA
jgi:methylamine dehydrogenase accessory protein MauD